MNYSPRDQIATMAQFLIAIDKLVQYALKTVVMVSWSLSTRIQSAIPIGPCRHRHDFQAGSGLGAEKHCQEPLLSFSGRPWGRSRAYVGAAQHVMTHAAACCPFRCSHPSETTEMQRLCQETVPDTCPNGGPYRDTLLHQ